MEQKSIFLDPAKGKKWNEVSIESGGELLKGRYTAFGKFKGR